MSTMKEQLENAMKEIHTTHDATLVIATKVEAIETTNSKFQIDLYNVFSKLNSHGERIAGLEAQDSDKGKKGCVNIRLSGGAIKYIAGTLVLLGLTGGLAGGLT